MVFDERKKNHKELRKLYPCIQYDILHLVLWKCRLVRDHKRIFRFRIHAGVFQKDAERACARFIVVTHGNHDSRFDFFDHFVSFFRVETAVSSDRNQQHIYVADLLDHLGRKRFFDIPEEADRHIVYAELEDGFFQHLNSFFELVADGISLTLHLFLCLQTYDGNLTHLILTGDVEDFWVAVGCVHTGDGDEFFGVFCGCCAGSARNIRHENNIRLELFIFDADVGIRYDRSLFPFDGEARLSVPHDVHGVFALTYRSCRIILDLQPGHKAQLAILRLRGYDVVMIPEVKKSAAVAAFPHRRPDSHKGNNGRVLIVGGSIDYYGAPILSALGALKSGVDLVYLFVPECNFDVTRSLYPDFIVRRFGGEHGGHHPSDHFTTAAISGVLELARTCDAILVGPGMGDHPETAHALDALIPQLTIPTILDSVAIMSLRRIQTFPLNQDIIITPHLNEFHQLTDKPFLDRDPEKVMEKKLRYCQNLALDLQIHILLKGVQDLIVSTKGHAVVSSTGNAGMTVGGSGDVLAGFLTSLIARGVPMFEAAQCAAWMFGTCGDRLAKSRGYTFSASDLACELAMTIASVVKF